MLLPPAAIEAILFASGGPMGKGRLAGLLGITEVDLTTALKALSEALTNRGIVLVESADEVELRTSPDSADIIKKLRESEFSRDLGKAGLETLSVILYRGMGTRSEIDWIRGVNSSATVRSLLLRGLVERAEDPTDARKIQYRATTDALAHLGVESANMLPRFEELSRGVKDAAEVPLEAEDNHAAE